MTGTRLRADKRAAIIAGALEVFARDGYARASIDAIAAGSAVSTRTIYKHFADKAAVYAAVIADSAAAVAERETALIAEHLDDVTAAAEVEPALTAFAVAWLSRSAQPETHRALIRQVRADVDHLGADLVAAWWAAGPSRVRAELAARLEAWTEAGLVDAADPAQAAVHFSQLVSASPGPYPAGDDHDWIAAGVRAFLRGYRR